MHLYSLGFGKSPYFFIFFVWKFTIIMQYILNFDRLLYFSSAAEIKHYKFRIIHSFCSLFAPTKPDFA